MKIQDQKCKIYSIALTADQKMQEKRVLNLTIETIQNETKRKKDQKKNMEQTFSDPSDNTKCVELGEQEKWEVEDNGQKLEEIMTEDFTNLLDAINPQLQEAQLATKWVNTLKKPIPMYVKLLKW